MLEIKVFCYQNMSEVTFGFSLLYTHCFIVVRLCIPLGLVFDGGGKGSICFKNAE